MKIIDLLNKIANNEEIPLKIKVEGYEYRKSNGQYWCDETEMYLIDNCTSIYNLNDEIEIIEEDKPAIAREELENRIENALEFLETQYNTFPSGEMWREALKNTLQGKEYDDVYVEDKKIEFLPMLEDEVFITSCAINQTRRKINEIIDYINKGDK